MWMPMEMPRWEQALPQLTLMSRRPTEVELYTVAALGQPTRILLLRPNDRVELGTLEQPPAHRLNGALSPELPLLVEYLRVMEREARRRGCERLALRVSRLGDAPPQGVKQRLPSWVRLSQLRQYRLSLDVLSARLTATRPAEVALLRSEPLPVFAGADGSHFQKAPVYQPELVQLFTRIFEGCPDPELGGAVGHALAMLELSVAAAWLSPQLWRIYKGNAVLGMILARVGEGGCGELCYAGIVPEARGDKAVGWMLLEVVRAHLLSKGMKAVVCSVAMENLRSHAFFERVWGFEPVGYEELWMGEVSSIGASGLAGNEVSA